MSSQETAGLIAYQKAAGPPARVTSVDDSDHAKSSRHYQAGTRPGTPGQGEAGRGLAVDFGGAHQYARDPHLAGPELLAIAQGFLPVRKQLHELICSHLGYSIKDGQKVGMLAAAQHWNHCHVSVDRGVILAQLPAQLLALLPAPPPAPEVRPMYDPPIGPVAAVWQDADGKVIAGISPDGDIYAWACKWVGNVRGKPYWQDRKAAAIGPHDDGQDGYMVTNTEQEKYRLPDGLDVL